jgi:hypothetical protein
MKKIKWLEGEKTIQDFKTQGNDLTKEEENKYTFQAGKGVYTVYTKGSNGQEVIETITTRIYLVKNGVDQINITGGLIWFSFDNTTGNNVITENGYIRIKSGNAYGGPVLHPSNTIDWTGLTKMCIDVYLNTGSTFWGRSIGFTNNYSTSTRPDYDWHSSKNTIPKERVILEKSIPEGIPANALPCAFVCNREDWIYDWWLE